MEILQRRKLCREFLNKYSENFYPELVSKIFEIGLLTLKNSFNKLNFSLEELDNIIIDLSSSTESPLYKKIPQSNRNNKVTTQKKNGFPTEEEIFGKHDEEFSRPHKKIINNYQKTLKNPNFVTQNSEIYPNWWWNNKEEKNSDSEENHQKKYYENDFVYENYGENEDGNYYVTENNMNNDGCFKKDYSLKKLTKSNTGKQKLNVICNKNSKSQVKNKNKKQQNINIRNKGKMSKINKTVKNCNNFTMIEDKKYYDKNNNQKNLIYGYQKTSDYSKIPTHKYTYVDGKIIRIDNN